MAHHRLRDHRALHLLEGRLPGVGRLNRCRGGAEQQRLGGDRPTVAQDHGLLHGVLQLADVPWPGVLDELVLGRGVESRDRLLVLRGVALEELPAQGQNILAALTQGRQVDVDGVDAVEEVFAEAPLGHHAEQVAVRRRDQPDVDLARRVAAHADDLPALDGRQQLRLQVRREVADLVQEERSAVRDLELPGAVGPRVGEGPLDVAEELALEECFGYGAHVDRDHQLAAAARAVVNLAGEHLLARAVLARDEDVGIRCGDLLDDLADASHRGARAPEHRLLGRQLALDLLELLHLALRAREVVGVAQRGDQPVVVPGLDDEIDRPVAHGLHRQVDVGIGREEDDLHLGAPGADLPQPVDAFVSGVDPRREVHVEQDDVDTLLAQRRIERIGSRERQHPGKIFFQQQPQRREDAAVVVHDQYGSLPGHLFGPIFG